MYFINFKLNLSSSMSFSIVSQKSFVSSDKYIIKENYGLILVGPPYISKTFQSDFRRLPK